MMPDPLIYDRTIDEIRRVEALRSSNEQVPMDDTRISYDYRSMNRVEGWVKYISNLLDSSGYDINAQTKTDWVQSDLYDFDVSDRFIGNIHRIADKFSLWWNKSELPHDIDRLDYIEANTIEWFLHDTINMYNNMLKIFRRCGTINSGQVKIRARRD